MTKIPPRLSKAKKIPSRREKKKRELRETFYETAMELILKKGFDNVTIEDITQKVSIAKGTFFNYFPTKESILIYFMRRHIDEVKEKIIEDLKLLKTAQKKLEHLFSLLVSMVVINEPLVKWVLLESLRMRVYKKEKKEVSGKILKTVVDIIREGQERREIKKTWIRKRLQRCSRVSSFSLLSVGSPFKGIFP
jgi:AcrR family transcriptional regulator